MGSGDRMAAAASGGRPAGRLWQVGEGIESGGGRKHPQPKAPKETTATPWRHDSITTSLDPSVKDTWPLASASAFRSTTATRRGGALKAASPANAAASARRLPPSRSRREFSSPLQISISTRRRRRRRGVGIRRGKP
jgi:hypothetical protein